MFSFDDRAFMFDITPVENQFILEYLPDAPGDYVKVWLYGLMQCYRRADDMNADCMSHELNMTVDEIANAFRYWERRGLVQRISDKPPCYRYMNVKQRNLSVTDTADPAYERFTENLYAVFNNERRLHGGEIAKCYEWVEDSKMRLPPEVVIMLLKHMASIKGKNFTIASAEPLAVRLAEENARTIEEAEAVLSRDKKSFDGSRKILRILGMRRFPSEAEQKLYTKWNTEWGFSHDAIEKACDATTGGSPNFAYLDGILDRMRGENGRVMTGEDVENDINRAEPVREFLRVLGSGRMSRETRALYEEMASACPKDLIMTAATECARKGGSPEDVKKLLDSWMKKGIGTKEEAEKYIRHFEEQTSFIRELHALWGSRERVTVSERTLTDKWTGEWGFGRELILKAAEYAADAGAPMPYLDKILEGYREKNIRTAEEAERDRKAAGNREGTKPAKPAGNAGKILPAQDFEQRSYKDDPDDLLRFIKEMKATDGDA